MRSRAIPKPRTTARTRRGAVALAAALLTAALAGCYPPSIGAVGVRLINDTHRRVFVYYCNAACSGSGLEYYGSIAPEKSAMEGATSDMTPNYYLLRHRHGPVIGCVDMEFDGYKPHAHVRVSQAKPCGRDASG